MKTEDVTRDFLKAHILYKLARRRCWGGKHTELAHVRSGLPRGLEAVSEEVALELVNEGFLTLLKKTDQFHISLQSRRKQEIIKIVEAHFGKQLW